MVLAAIEAAEALAAEGIRAAVVDMHTIKPLDAKAVVAAARETGALVTAEEHTLLGGLGSAVAETTAAQYPVPVEMVGIRDRFGQSGEPDELLRRYGLTPGDICKAAKRAMGRKRG